MEKVKHREDPKEADRIIEHHLKQYKNYKISITNLEKQLEYIMPSITANYEFREGSVGAFSIHSKIENVVINRIEGTKAILLHEEKEQKRLIVEAIDKALAALQPEELEYIKLRYFENYKVYQIAAKRNCSVSLVHDIRRSALDKLKISLVFLTL